MTRIPPTIPEIILRNAQQAESAGITVDVNSPQSWVTISARGEQDIFLQTHEAEEFITEAHELAEEHENLCKDDIYLHLAISFAENHWN